MYKVLLAAVAMTGLFALTAVDASASPSSGLIGLHVASPHALVTNVDYYWHHRRWHYRRFVHGRWRYWN